MHAVVLSMQTMLIYFVFENYTFKIKLIVENITWFVKMGKKLQGKHLIDWIFDKLYDTNILKKYNYNDNTILNKLSFYCMPKFTRLL